MVNKNKNYKITVSTGTYGRDAIKTHFIKPEENIVSLVNRYVVPCYQYGNIISISSKIASLCQNRVIYKKDMRLSNTAKFLSKFASKSDAGIGVASVWKMQYALDFCGYAKVIFAAVCSGVGKLFGKRGIFYDIVGIEVSGLDGFYDKSFKEYGEFGIQIPLKCNELCDLIYEKTGVASFIVDANDFTRTVFGKAAQLPFSNEQLCEMISDNPAGQSDQCTPFVIIKYEYGESEISDSL